MRAMESTLIVRRSPTGSASRVLCCGHWSMRCVCMYLVARNSTPTTRRCRSCVRVAVRRNKDGCGPMFVMIGQLAASYRQRYGSPTRRIAKGQHPREHSEGLSRHPCKPMATRGSTNSTTMRIQIIPSKKLLAGLTCAASSTISMQATESPLAIDGHAAHRRTLRYRGTNPRPATPLSAATSARLRSGPLLDALYRWFKDTLTQVSAKSDLALSRSATHCRAGKHSRASPPTVCNRDR